MIGLAPVLIFVSTLNITRHSNTNVCFVATSQVAKHLNWHTFCSCDHLRLLTLKHLTQVYGGIRVWARLWCTRIFNDYPNFFLSTTRNCPELPHTASSPQRRPQATKPPRAHAEDAPLFIPHPYRSPNTTPATRLHWGGGGGTQMYSKIFINSWVCWILVRVQIRR